MSYIISILIAAIILSIIAYISITNPVKIDKTFKKAIREVSKKVEKEYKEEQRKRFNEIQDSLVEIKKKKEEAEKDYSERLRDLEGQLAKIKTEHIKEVTNRAKIIDEAARKEQERMNKELLDKRKEVDEELHEINQKYLKEKEEYEEKIEGLNFSYLSTQSQMQTLIKEKQKEIAAMIENFKQDEVVRNQANFYCILPPIEATKDIEKLRRVAAELTNPSILYKLIYKTYYENAFNLMCGRVLEKENGNSGIYKITNTKNQMVYIGQTKAGFKNRWRTHVKRGLRAEEGTNNKLYTAMWEEGIENFTFQVVEVCEESKLTERERFYIDLYDSKNFGYNAKM